MKDALLGSEEVASLMALMDVERQVAKLLVENVAVVESLVVDQAVNREDRTFYSMDSRQGMKLMIQEVVSCEVIVGASVDARALQKSPLEMDQPVVHPNGEDYFD